MSEYDWPDHPDDDGGDGLGDAHDDAALPGGDDPLAAEHDDGLFDDDVPVPQFGHSEHGGYDPAPHLDPAPEPESSHAALVAQPGMGPVGADPDAAVDTGDDPAAVFPPAVDVGPLPEPVDGFPWIDTGSLGLVGAGPVDAAALSPVDPQDLAEYAAADLPPGVDPWAALAASDDPATSALARWWSEHGH
jgi:hypothetical protein